MSLTLSVYSKHSFCEYILPALNNADYTETVRGEAFHLKEDFSLRLEVIDNVWKLQSTSDYRILEDGQSCNSCVLTDDQVLKIRTRFGELLSIIVADQKNPFRAYEKIPIDSIGRLSIGRNSSNDIVYNLKGMVSREHAVIESIGNKTVIRNVSERNAIYVNSRRIDDEIELNFGDFINVVGLHMVFLGESIALDTGSDKISRISEKLAKSATLDERTAIMTNANPDGEAVQIYQRAPRTIKSYNTDPIEIEAPPTLQNQKKQSLFMLVGPSITMALPMVLGCLLMVYAYSGSGMAAGRSSLFMYSGLVMAVSSALVGAIWAVANVRSQRKEESEIEEKRSSKYGEYLVSKANDIRERYEQTLEIMNDNYPNPERVMKYDENNGLLWNRNRSHKDILTHRIGTGNIPFPTEIKIPQKRFTLDDDSLADKPAFIKENYETLYDAPITVDLAKYKMIGIVGGKGNKGAYELVRTLSSQIAACNCYTEVKLAYLFNEKVYDGSSEWEFTKWLPHVWSENRKTRYVACDKSEAGDVFYELTDIFRTRQEQGDDRQKKSIPMPYYIVFVTDPSMITGEMFAKYAAEKDPRCGLTTILVAESYEQLPNDCDLIIENTERFTGFYVPNDSKDEKLDINIDRADEHSLEQFGRRKASLRVIEMSDGGELPDSLTFFEMLKVRKPEELKAEELWAKNRTYENIKGQLGVKTGGTPCYLDVHEKYHGPHGLVAGTTGSGKSETLQTYMLSLAVNYSPDDIGFFVIDYKGGGMANLFNGLPHMVGQISNLSGNQVRRAMISIKSENRRRQRIFNENGVNNINSYTKLVKGGEATLPVPHLFIVIDEFAELKREEPEFMRELISVAQVGRSLGVHLILATQKPSGTVDENIWSNSKFRLCLRVQDRQDSMDMLHKPDAAFITQAGRCYLQVGNDEVYELFQSGYSGAIYDENIDVGESDIVRLLTLNGRVEMTGNSLKQSQKRKVAIAWLETLVECLSGVTREGKIMPADAAGNQLIMDQVITGMYQKMRNSGIDYPENRYNSARLEDFIHMCAEANQVDDPHKLAETLLTEVEASSRMLPQPKEKTELDSVKEYLADVADKRGYKIAHKLWLPVLGDHIYLDAFDEFHQNEYSRNWGWSGMDEEWNLSFVFGQWDDPETQSQPPVILDLARDGNMAICGSVVSGKSTAMQTIAYSLMNRYSPDAVNIYALDFSSKMMSAIEHAPHVGGVMYENDLDKIDKFFNMMISLLKERKNLMRGGNYAQYIRTNGLTMPAIVVMIDNYASFKEKTGEKYEDQVIQLSKEGINHGIYLIVTGGGFGMNDITTRVAENLNTVITLALPDKFAYGDLLRTMGIEVMPETGIKGRGLAWKGDRVLEFQTALAVEAETDYQRMEIITQRCEEYSRTWAGRKARPIPQIPSKPNWKIFSDTDEYESVIETGDVLPVGYNSDNASVYGIPLASTYCYGVYGSRMSGRINFLKACAMAARDQKAGVCIIDGLDEELSLFRDFKNVIYCSNEDEVFDFFEKLTPIFQKRNKRKQELIAEGYEDEQLFNAMRTDNSPLYVIITDMSWFIPMIYDSEYEMKGFMETIINKGQYHGIYFIGSLALEKRSTVAGYAAFESFAGYKKGIHMGGRMVDDPLLDFDYLSYSEKEKAEAADVGILSERLQRDDPWRIIIPQVKGS